MKKAIKQPVTLKLTSKEFWLLLLSVGTALKQRTCKESFPSGDCKVGLRRLDKRLYSFVKDAPKAEVSHV